MYVCVFTYSMTTINYICYTKVCIMNVPAWLWLYVVMTCQLQGQMDLEPQKRYTLVMFVGSGACGERDRKAQV